MHYLELFLAFFIPNIIGYGGGPAIIPLIEAEVVTHYGWMTASQFAETLALGNALPSPIATKMAGQIGYQVAGIPGAAIALVATAAPSLVLMLVAMGVLARFSGSIQVQRMGQWVRPVLVVLMLTLAVSFGRESLALSGQYHSLGLAVAAALLLIRFKWHPAFVVVLSLGYGALFLG